MRGWISWSLNHSLQSVHQHGSQIECLQRCCYVILWFLYSYNINVNPKTTHRSHTHGIQHHHSTCNRTLNSIQKQHPVNTTAPQTAAQSLSLVRCENSYTPIPLSCGLLCATLPKCGEAQCAFANLESCKALQRCCLFGNFKRILISSTPPAHRNHSSAMSKSELQAYGLCYDQQQYTNSHKYGAS